MTKQQTWLACLLCVLLVTSSHAGTTGKISGTVTNRETGEPLVGVNILVEGTRFGAATDLDGFFYILNLPPGQFDIRAQYIGFQAEIQTGVAVRSDFTTNLDFQLSSSAVELEAVEYVAERPHIQKDLTSSEQGFQASELEAAPIQNMDELLTIQAGINELGSEASGFVAGAPGDGMHIRGGRENETLFIIDGVKVGDDIYGGSRYIQNSSGSSINEMKTIIGTFNAEYGGKTAGVISVVTRDGGAQYHMALGGYTDHFGIEAFDKNTYQGDVTLSGPIPYTKKLTFFVNAQARTTDGRKDLVGYDIPYWEDSNGQIGRTAPGEEVPLAWQDDWNSMGKLTFQVTDRLRFQGSYFHSQLDKGDYKHVYRYIPYAQAWTELKNNGFIGKMTHSLSAATMYEVLASYQTTDFFYGVDEDVAGRVLLGQRQTIEDFYYSGATNDWNVDSSRTWQVSANFTSQITKRHLLKMGTEWRQLDVVHRQDEAGGSGVTQSNGVVFPIYLSYAERWPIEMAAYIQDKMEFTDIGMIMNLGVRIEYWDARMNYMEDPNDPYNTSLLSTDSKLRISPRFGISYPVSDKAAFHLAYGHFYQFPRYMEILAGFNDYGYLSDRPVLSSSPGVSNPNANPEKTVSYETGVQFQIVEGLTANVTGYYREMSSLMGVRWIDYGYIYLDNVDFGNSKGVEMKLDKRLSDMWSARLNYTWSTSSISTSSPLTSAQSNKFLSYKTFSADWDRPHDLSLILMFSEPGAWAISTIYSARSGRPYSVLAEELNTERMPTETNMDVKLTKFFQYGSVTGQVYLNVGNVFDTRNIRSVYPETGEWDDDGESGSPYDLDAVPSRRSEGRTARIGFKFSL